MKHLSHARSRRMLPGGLIVILALLALLLAACQTATTQPASTPTPQEPQATSYPAAEEVPQTNPDYPAQSGEQPALDGAYPVLPGDETRVAGNFFIDQMELRPNPSNNAQTDLFVTGSLPTPCHEIRAFVSPPDGANNINIQVYSVADPDKICTQVLQPYEGVATTLKDLPAGKYVVTVNGNFAGEVTIQ